MLCEFHFDHQLFSINEMDIRAVEPPIAAYILFGVPS